ncbi:MAG: DUF3307 domain-containing protein [Bacteroidales bacterium]
MTVYQLILLQLMAHLVADFLLQSKKWCKEKEKHVITKQHILHAVVVSITAYGFSLDTNFGISALIIGFTHFVIDALKSYFVQKQKDKKAFLFFVDQFLHILVLCIVSWFYLRYYVPERWFNVPISMYGMAIISAFLFCAKPANVVIKNVFSLLHLTIPPTDSTNKSTAPEKDLENAGKVIGIMERFMTLALVLSGQYAAVGLIIAAKSILRFSNTQKNEYILVGTLLSFGFAILIGVTINHLA